MASNTPKTTTKSSSNTNPTPNNPSLSSSDIRVVSQTQDSERLFDTPDSSSDHQNILNPLCVTEQTDNPPQWQSPQAPLAIIPVISSPNRSIMQQNVADELFM